VREIIVEQGNGPSLKSCNLPSELMQDVELEHSDTSVSVRKVSVINSKVSR